MNDQTKARIAANEALFRAVNEKIDDLNSVFATVTETFMIVCECGDSGCGDQIEVDARTYEGVRADPTLFMIVPGHEVVEVESIVDRHENFDVVRKRPGTPGEAVAVATDPRAE